MSSFDCARDFSQFASRQRAPGVAQRVGRRSAALIESLGAPAIATTSAGVCWARGCADGDTLPLDELVATARAIARVVRVPLSVDMEGGYSNEPSAVAELAARLIDVGAVGINIEDGAQPPELLCRKIEAIRRLTGNGVFINARVDVFLRSLAKGEAAMEEVGRRAGLWAAGCDGIFRPRVGGPAVDGRHRARDRSPAAQCHALVGIARSRVLHQHGVRRLSAGSALAQAAMGHAARLTRELLAGNGQALLWPAGWGTVR